MSYTITNHALDFFSAFAPWFIAVGGLIVLALTTIAWPRMIKSMNLTGRVFYPWRVGWSINGLTFWVMYFTPSIARVFLFVKSLHNSARTIFDRHSRRLNAAPPLRKNSAVDTLDGGRQIPLYRTMAIPPMVVLPN